MIGKAIDPPLPLCGDKCRLPGRRQAAGLPRHSQEVMAKAVIIEETMHIGAEYKTVGTDNAIAQRAAFAQPCDFRKRTGAVLIDGFAQMNLIPLEQSFGHRPSEDS